MITTNHLLFQIAEVEHQAEKEPQQNQAILACCQLFRSVADNHARKEASFIELSNQIDR